MKTRRRKSGGQAIVMVTLALFAMTGMMGLAVDLGWSFFIQKQAQAAADGAAVAAAHEAYVALNGSVGGLATSCPGTIDCTGGTCGGISTSLNTYNGCLYAKSNGFNWDVSGSNQTVTITAGYNSTPPTVNQTGLLNVAYWVTVTAVQNNVPQLFSALAGNTTGTVAAIATAALAATTVPGSFIGLDREGDCFVANGTNECGVDLDVAGSGGKNCPGSGQKAKLCGPRGIFLSSQCNGTSLPSGASAGACGSGNGNYAGETHGAADVWGSTIGIRGSGAVNAPAKWTPTPISNASSGVFSDPESGFPQPPLAASSAAPVCPILGGTINGGTLGPFQYVSYHQTVVGGVTTNVLDGNQITLSGTVNFQATGTCPYTSGATSGAQGGTAQGAGFPTYVFYGGLNIAGTANFDSGQYVLAGTTAPDTTSTQGTLLNVGGTMNTTNGSGGGNMFILATPLYPGLSTQESALASIPGISNSISTLKTTGGVSTSLTAGSTEWDGNGTLTGIDGSNSHVASAGLDQYGNILFWQDRNNSTVTYDSTGNVTSQTNSNLSCPSLTCTSPEFYFNHGNPSAVLTGVLYQPRGSWIDMAPGDASVQSSPLQIITGALVTETGGGNTTVTLLGTAPSLVIYRTSLIQ